MKRSGWAAASVDGEGHRSQPRLGEACRGETGNVRSSRGRVGVAARHRIIGWTPTFVNGLVVFPTLGLADGGDVNNWGKKYPFGGIIDPTGSSLTALPANADDLRRTAFDGVVIGDAVIVSDFLLDPVTGTTAHIPALPVGQLLEPTLSAAATRFSSGAAPGEPRTRPTGTCCASEPPCRARRER